MLGFQSLEASLAWLVMLEQFESPDVSSFEEAREEVDKLYELTMGRLKNMVGTSVSEELLEDLERARQGRNYLAHHYLRERVEELARGSAHRREMIEDLEEIERQLGELMEAVGEVGRVRIRERGGDPVAARRLAKRLHEEGIGFGTLRRELIPLVAKQRDAEGEKEQDSPSRD